ncbi:MAG: nucleotidyltransferase substrate binding protein [Alkalispirochaeta sp.]|jgi:hypothetical protein
MDQDTRWLQGLEDRNLTAHTYNEMTAQQVDAMIRGIYFGLFTELEKVFADL